jgi:endonuclease-8
MPEGDTVWLTAHRLDQALGGRPLTRFELRVPALATSDLTGHQVTEVVARGKHILTRIEPGFTLHSHLRMDGSWYLTPQGRRANRHPEHMIRALLGNSEWLATGYRMHDLALIPTEQEHTLVGHLGPDLLGPDWDVEEAIDRLRAQPDQSIGEALLDQRRLAGVGNMYRAEILFVEGVNPWTKVADVVDLGSMMRTSYRLLRMNRDHPEQSTTGITVRGRQHWVYLRAGQPCQRCGTTIRVAEQGEPPRQRTTYWCPTCQPAIETLRPEPL